MLLLCWPLLTGGASRSFDGANDEITFGNLINTTTGNQTVCVWWKGTDDASADFIFGKKGDLTAATLGYAISQTSGDIDTYNVGDGTESVTSSGTDQDGAWVWICGTWNSTSEVTILYENGVQVDTDTTANMDTLSNASELQMGEDHNNGNDALGLIALGYINGNVVMPVLEINEIMWKPDSVYMSLAGDNVSLIIPLWGDSPEQDISGINRDGTIVAGTTISQDGPPIMFGNGLPL